MSRYEDDHWQAIDLEPDLDPGNDSEFEPLPPPRHTRNIIRDLADYQPTQ